MNKEDDDEQIGHMEKKLRLLERALLFAIFFGALWIGIYIFSQFVDMSAIKQNACIYCISVIAGTYALYGNKENCLIWAFGVEGFLICVLTVCTRIGTFAKITF